MYIFWDYPNPPWELHSSDFFGDDPNPRVRTGTASRFQVTFSNLKLKLSDDVYSPKAGRLLIGWITRPGQRLQFANLNMAQSK